MAEDEVDCIHYDKRFRKKHARGRGLRKRECAYYIQAAKNFWKKVKEDIHVSNKSQGYMIKCYGQHCKYCMYTFDPDLPLMRAPKRNAEFARQIKCKYSFVASTYVAITASLD